MHTFLLEGSTKNSTPPGVRDPKNGGPLPLLSLSKLKSSIPRKELERAMPTTHTHPQQENPAQKDRAGTLTARARPGTCSFYPPHLLVEVSVSKDMLLTFFVLTVLNFPDWRLLPGY